MGGGRVDWVIECKVFGEGRSGSSWRGTVSINSTSRRTPSYLDLSEAL